MRTFIPLRFILFVFFSLVFVSTVTVIAATNTVPPTRAEIKSSYAGPNHLKPYACTGLYLTATITGSGTITGTAGSDLILGSSAADTIDGLGGDDCILGGGGDDMITGNDGMDVCIGGTGANIFVTCEGQ